MRKLTVALAVLVLMMVPLASAKSTFGSGLAAPLPNVTSLEIYDVTGLTGDQRKLGGTLVDSGFNKTLKLKQQEYSREYRFTFDIRNDGGFDWTIASDDSLYHEGLNQSWTVTDVWYNITANTGINQGGTFSGGRVSWDTSNGGTLAAGGTMKASYVVNVTIDSSKNYSEHFYVEDTSAGTGSEDYHKLNARDLGYLFVDLSEPPNDTVLHRYKEFEINGTVTCKDGECGSVNVSARYNTSSSADTLIPQSGTPFEIITGSNTRNCASGLSYGASCTVTWAVNATAAENTDHLLDVNASSNIEGMPTNNSFDNLVHMNSAVIMNLMFNKIDFGVLAPGQTDRPAKNNSDHYYNISIAENSLTADAVWVRASDLLSDQLSYSIPAENMSYALTNDPANENPLSNTYQRMTTNVSAGTNVTSFFWIDVPQGIYKGGYTGNMYFKANTTG